MRGRHDKRRFEQRMNSRERAACFLRLLLAVLSHRCALMRRSKRLEVQPASTSKRARSVARSFGDADAAIAALPNDILAIVLLHIAQRPRLLVLSLVCRRWHQLIASTISSVSVRLMKSTEHPKRLSYSKFSALQHLDLMIKDPNIHRIEVPSRLISLTLGGECICGQLSHVSHLTSLAFRNHKSPHMLNLISQNAETLCSLQIP